MLAKDLSAEQEMSYNRMSTFLPEALELVKISKRLNTLAYAGVIEPQRRDIVHDTLKQVYNQLVLAYEGIDPEGQRHFRPKLVTVRCQICENDNYDQPPEDWDSVLAEFED